MGTISFRERRNRVSVIHVKPADKPALSFSTGSSPTTRVPVISAPSMSLRNELSNSCSPDHGHTHLVTADVRTPLSEASQGRSRAGTQSSLMVPTSIDKNDLLRRSNTSSYRAVSETEYADASHTAVKIRELIEQIDKDEDISKDVLRETLVQAADFLSSLSGSSSPELADSSTSKLQQLVPHDEVREWLASTFTSKDRKSDQEKSSSNKPSFKSVVGTVMTAQYLDKRLKEAQNVTYPVGLSDFFKEYLFQWNCDIFKLDHITNSHPLKYIGFELFKIYDFRDEFQIPIGVLDNFLHRVEKGYKLHDNPYHNATHAADVTQTVHYIITYAGLQKWLSKMEMLALLFSAMIHDVEHTGTTNTYHIESNSDLALLYNDQSVLENYHLQKSFSIMNEGDGECNIFKNLTREQYREVRKLSVAMVLSTDMSKHFTLIKDMKRILKSPDGWDQIQTKDRSSFFNLILHTADIAHTGKEWKLHEKWTYRLVEEFFRQGDMEKELQLPVSPLCDRNTTVVPKAQTGFFDFIITPLFKIFEDIISLVVDNTKDCDSQCSDKELQAWSNNVINNRQQWQNRDSKTCDSTSDHDQS